jgi:hypothetical protein
MAEPSSSPPLWARAPRAQPPPPMTGLLGRAVSSSSAPLRLPRRRCRPSLLQAGLAPSTRVAGMAPTAPTADQASRCHHRRPAHPAPCVPALASARRRASSHPTPSVWTAAPAPSSRCARTAPTAARATSRRPRRHIPLPWCTRTTASKPVTAAALAPSSRRAPWAPTASTVARASPCHRRLHGHQQRIRHPTHRRAASARPSASLPPTLIAMTAASAA